VRKADTDAAIEYGAAIQWELMNDTPNTMNN
jgi:hypothetical protein